MRTKEKAICIVLFTAVMSAVVSIHAQENVIPCKRHGRTYDCVAVPMMSNEDDAAAKLFQPPTDKSSRVYVVRPYMTRLKEKTEIFIDGKLAGDLGPRTYVVLAVSPGTHHLSAQTDGQTTDLQIKTASGTVTFIRYQLDRLFNKVTGAMELIDEADGKSDILSSKRALAAPLDRSN